MQNTILLYKPISITPLQLTHKFRQQYPEYEKVTLGYAGRLDPMADGLLLLLAGEENKKRKSYEDLSKEYACEVLFGIETDTYDILGKIINQTSISQHISETVQEILQTFLGKQIQPYPPYSSQPVNGKPLYYWARKNKLDEITLPTKAIEIYDIALLSQKAISAKDLEKIIFERIQKVTGDFRQKEIVTVWKEFFEKNNHQTFTVFRFRIACSSGTYIRSFAHNLGRKLGSSAIALRITRTKIGNYL